VKPSNNLPRPVWLEPFEAPKFPNPAEFDEQGLVAIGGDLSPRSLTAAYLAGIFPWYQKAPILWWSPDPRGVIDPQNLHISRSLRRHLRQLVQDPEISVVATPRIGPVMRACGSARESTWITPEMLYAYGQLASRGRARAFEVRRNGALVGGLYGVLLGGLFAAESMFHIETDASKVALVAAVLYQFATGTELFDVQFQTSHLSTLGVYEIPRQKYLARLRELKPPPENELSSLPLAPSSPSPGDPPGGTPQDRVGASASLFAQELLPWVVERVNLL
jgi:leucyl/phenylalanyl-tRNA---protein transferase